MSSIKEFDILRSYSLVWKDFEYKREQNVVYETARTSMDNLANLGFYKKEQIRNKFVYTPVVRD